MKATNDELNRWIAEKLEPKPEFLRKYDSNGLPVLIFISQKGCWIFENDEEWHPRDFCSDPAITTVMLVEKMREPRIRRHFFEPSLWVVECHSENGTFTTTIQNVNLGRAVAEAFALANGYKE